MLITVKRYKLVKKEDDYATDSENTLFKGENIFKRTIIVSNYYTSQSLAIHLRLSYRDLNVIKRARD